MDCSLPGLLRPWNSLGKNTGVGSPFPSPGHLPDPGIKPRSPILKADSLLSQPPRKKKKKAQIYVIYQKTDLKYKDKKVEYKIRTYKYQSKGS